MAEPRQRRSTNSKLIAHDQAEFARQQAEREAAEAEAHRLAAEAERDLPGEPDPDDFAELSEAEINLIAQEVGDDDSDDSDETDYDEAATDSDTPPLSAPVPALAQPLAGTPSLPVLSRDPSHTSAGIGTQPVVRRAEAATISRADDLPYCLRSLAYSLGGDATPERWQRLAEIQPALDRVKIEVGAKPGTYQGGGDSPIEMMGVEDLLAFAREYFSGEWVRFSFYKPSGKAAYLAVPVRMTAQAVTKPDAQPKGEIAAVVELVASFKERLAEYENDPFRQIGKALFEKNMAQTLSQVGVAPAVPAQAGVGSQPSLVANVNEVLRNKQRSDAEYAEMKQLLATITGATTGTADDDEEEEIGIKEVVGFAQAFGLIPGGQKPTGTGNPLEAALSSLPDIGADGQQEAA